LPERWQHSPSGIPMGDNFARDSAQIPASALNAR
jgi:hypothetical protein